MAEQIARAQITVPDRWLGVWTKDGSYSRCLASDFERLEQAVQRTCGSSAPFAISNHHAPQALGRELTDPA